MIKEIRCSGLARPMTCAGSLFFTDLPEQEEIEAAKEGTAFGELVAHKIRGSAFGVQASNGVQFDNDMHFYCDPIVENVMARAKGSEVRCEQSIDWQTQSGIWIKGTYDMGYVTVEDGKKVLNIDDNKYGWRLVEVKDNWQLLGYAIGEALRLREVFSSIRLRILQPRPHHEDGVYREWILTYDELITYKEKIESRCWDIVRGERSLVTNNSCRYCPAAAEHCPAIGKAFFRSVEVVHEFVQDRINNDELSFQLDLAMRIAEIAKTKHDSLKALAVDRLKKGQIIPNYVMEENYGDRKWKSTVTPDLIEMMTGKKIVEQVMLSPAKAEKAGVPKEVVNSLVDRHYLGAKPVRKDHSKLGDKIFGKTK